jgi:hypothetical protein
MTKYKKLADKHLEFLKILTFLVEIRGRSCRSDTHWFGAQVIFQNLRKPYTNSSTNFWKERKHVIILVSICMLSPLLLLAKQRQLFRADYCKLNDYPQPQSKGSTCLSVQSHSMKRIISTML